MTIRPTGFAALAALTLGALAAGCANLPDPATRLAIETVATRADLVSGGDALLRFTLPETSDAALARVTVNGAPLASGLRPAPDGDGWLALVDELKDGANTVTLSTGGRTTRLTLTNHPNAGPIFSGPQIQPWTCRDGAMNAGCDRATTYEYVYMPTGGGRFQPWNAASPPSDVATITTPEGASLPYIVRVENFSQNRSGVSVATLFDPKRDWTPYAPQPQWNGGVLVLQGSGCGTGYGEQEAGSPLNERALGQGFIVVAAALLHNTINCNPVVQAETALMAKEHVAETYGPFDIIFGMGSSGGAISQVMAQNAYPGLYDGLILNHLFADSDASRANAYDCMMIREAWDRPGAPAWTDDQKAAVAGMLSGCNAAPTRWQVYDPAIGTRCEIADELKFDLKTRPKGVRCTLQDYEVNQAGRRPDGYANGRIDTTGVQFGLEALKAGIISAEQFVDLNASIGGHDISFQPQAARIAADRAGLALLYRSGVNNTMNNLGDTAIIETRASVTDFHQPFHAVMVRARLLSAQGHHDNYALWWSPNARENGFDAAFDVMVAWLRAIKADARDLPKAQKVISNRPALAHDRCIADGADLASTACPRPPALARVLAGAPDSNNLGSCQLQPMRRADYAPAVFSDAQWARLAGKFPGGVCDYSKPMIDFELTAPWRVYEGDGRARALGDPPTSRR